MLQKFQVKNFKNFNDNFVFDLTEIKNYEFNTECINDGTVAKALIYGPNGCGKSNLGRAIFDIKTHLTDNKIDDFYFTNYLNAESTSDYAEFIFTFKFGNSILEYSYGKKTVNKIVYEVLKIDDKRVISFDRSKDNLAYIDLEGAESLNRNLGNSDLSAGKDKNILTTVNAGDDLSVVKYVKNNTVLKNNSVNQVLKTFFKFVEYMDFFRTTDYSEASILIDSVALRRREKDLKKFEHFLNDEVFVKCKLTIIKIGDEEKLAFDFGNKKITFFENASTGTISLTALYLILSILNGRSEIIALEKKLKEKQGKELESVAFFPFVFIDEFDAFYHYAAAKSIIKTLKNIKCQAILTTHNTNIMSNDLLRPDCYFIMSNTGIKPIYSFTNKELREAHNIEKMYRAGVFNE